MFLLILRWNQLSFFPRSHTDLVCSVCSKTAFPDLKASILFFGSTGSFLGAEDVAVNKIDKKHKIIIILIEFTFCQWREENGHIIVKINKQKIQYEMVIGTMGKNKVGKEREVCNLK